MTTNRSFMLTGSSEIFEINDTFKTIKILWPRGSKMPTIHGKWKKMGDGRILATYTYDELKQCLKTFYDLYGE